MSWARDHYLKMQRDRVFKQSTSKRTWNTRERWRTARLVIRVVLSYSPRSVGTALIVAGMLIQMIDESWEKPREL